MLSEQIAPFLEEEDLRHFVYKLENAMDNAYVYAKYRHEIMQVLAEIVKTAYKKGRMDESYHNNGPIYSLYEE